MTQKREAFKKTLQWQVSKVGIVVAVIFTIVWILLGFIAVGVASALQFWQNHPTGTIHTAIVFVACLALAANGIAWIVLTVRKPTLELDVNNDAQAKSTAAEEAPLPWWTLFLVYPLCLAYIGVWSYLLIIYGIKFGPEKQKQWLLSTFTGIANDLFVNEPFNIVKELLLMFLLYLLAVLFFDSAIRDTSSQVQIAAATGRATKVSTARFSRFKK